MQFHCPTSFQRQSTDFILRLPREELGLGRGRGGGGRGGGGGQKRARKTEESGSSGSSGLGGRRKKMARKTAKLEVAAADPDGRSKMDAVEVADEETGSNRWIAHVNKYVTIPPDFRQMPR